MAATSMRLPSKHQTPLKTLNRGNHFLRSHRSASNAKRKSAVELLQESKAFYVKSEIVLDRKQELRNSGHLQVTSSAGDAVLQLRGPFSVKKTNWSNNQSRHNDSKYIQPPSSLVVLTAPTLPPRPSPPTQHSAPPLPPKSPRLVSTAHRRSGSQSVGSDQLQIKLRKLLNADSKENVFIPDNTDGRRIWDDEDVKTVAGDERPYSRSYVRNVAQTYSTISISGVHNSHHKSLPDLHSSPARSNNSSSVSSTESSELIVCDGASVSSSRHCRRSLGSSGGRSLASQHIYSQGSSIRSPSSQHKSSQGSSVRSQSSQHNISQGSSRSSQNNSSREETRRNSNASSGRRSHRSSRHSLSSRHCSPECTRLKSPPLEHRRENSGSDARIHESGRIGNIARDAPFWESPLSPSGRLNQREDSSSSYSDSVGEEAMSPHKRAHEGCWNPELRRPILRSKSDISHRYSRNKPPRGNGQQNSCEQLQQFFDQLGLDNKEYRSISAPTSDTSSPVYFESVSSIDSLAAWNPWVTPGADNEENSRPSDSQHLSIVERNARIIKWLCNCRKIQLASRRPS